MASTEPEMSDEELEEWGINYVENEWDEEDNPYLTEQQKAWLDKFLEESAE